MKKLLSMQKVWETKRLDIVVSVTFVGKFSSIQMNNIYQIQLIILNEYTVSQR